jgi:hypothetical protein
MAGKVAKARRSHSRSSARNAESRSQVEEFVPKTELGKTLWAIRKKIEASGVPLLNRDELEEEIKSRRGGYFEDE